MDTAPDATRLWRLLGIGLLVSLVVAGCDRVVHPQVDRRATPEQIEMILTTASIDTAPEEVGAAFAIGGAATGLQRQRLKDTLLGSVVQWDMVVYDVSLEGGVYTVVSQPLAGEEGNAVMLLRAVAAVTPREDADATRLERVRTGDRIRIRGVVQDLMLRTVVWIEPAILIEVRQPGSPENE